MVVKGHGVASGCAPDCPYPGGSLARQIPCFQQHGVDLTGFHRGTLNVDVSPQRCVPFNPDLTLRQVRWTDRIPPEDFSFLACLLVVGGTTYRGLIYYPHPETKVEHFQNDSLLEVMAPFIAGLNAGAAVTLRLRRCQVRWW